MQRIALTASMLSLAASASAQSIIDLGALPGGTYSGAYDASDDGTVVVGTAQAGDGEYRAFRWTAATGMRSLGVFPGSEWAQSYGVSPDGSVVVGFAVTSDGTRAFRWTPGGGLHDLGLLPTGLFAVAYDASAGDPAVVGYVQTPTGQRGYRWTQATGMVDLGALPGATDTRMHAVSHDGATAVGQSDGKPVVWTEHDGLRELPPRDGGWSGSGVAFAVDATGSAICGVDGWQTFLWTREAGTRILPPPPGRHSSIANAISADGRTVGGEALDDFLARRAFIWRESTGMVELETYLDVIGVPAWGWELESVNGISADGRSLVGEGRFLGEYRAFLITGLPRVCRVDMNGNGTLDIFDFLEFQNAFDTGSDRADINGDGSLDIFDFLEFQNMFDAGCP